MTTIDDLNQAIIAIENELGITPSSVYASIRTRLDILEARINNPFAPAPNVPAPFFIGNTGVTISVGVGLPTENRIPGALYLREDGYNAQGLYAMRVDGYWHQVTTDPGINRIIHATITHSLSPYTVTLLDDFIPVNSSSGPVTITLPASPILGKGYTIADQNGTALTNNITVSGNGFNINGLGSFVLNTNYQLVTVIFNGVNWSKV